MTDQPEPLPTVPRQFRKKPVVIEAVPFQTNNDDGSCIRAILKWASYDGMTTDETFIYIATLEGVMQAEVGDWIIRGVAGEFYPCKPQIFEATYEPA